MPDPSLLNGTAKRPRSRLLEVIEEQPGMSIAEISQRLALSRGSTRYHLRRLRAHIATVRQGNQVLHFASTLPPMQRKAIAMLRIASVRAIVDAVAEAPVTQPSKLARQVGITTRSVRRNIHLMVQAGIAKDEPDDSRPGARRVVLHPEARLAWVLWCKDADDSHRITTLRKSPGWVFGMELLLAKFGLGLFS